VSGYQTNLLTGLAAYIAAAGIGTWDPTTPYGDTETGITLYTMPQKPDRIICLSAYGVSDDPSLSDSVLGVQVRCRWGAEDPRYADDLADAIFDLLHGREQWDVQVDLPLVTTLYGPGSPTEIDYWWLSWLALSSDIHIVQCLRQSGPVPLGQDANKRYSNSQNFYCLVWRPSDCRT